MLERANIEFMGHDPSTVKEGGNSPSTEDHSNLSARSRAPELQTLEDDGVIYHRSSDLRTHVYPHMSPRKRDVIWRPGLTRN